MRIPPHERGGEPPADTRNAAPRPRGVDSASPHSDTSRLPSRSLMDDAEFLSELEHMEQHHDGESPSAPFHSTFDRLDDGLGHGTAETDHEAHRLWRDEDTPLAHDDAHASAAATDSRRNTILAILGFALMMAIGAAAAAFIFRDRLALLLR